jgi:hypothetical protein
MKTINLGTFDKGIAEYIINVFNINRGVFKERDPRRVKCHILQRGRGGRGGYIKNENYGNDKYSDYIRNTEFVRICSNYNRDLPVKYAQKVALYLKVNEEGKAKLDKALSYVGFIKSVKITHTDVCQSI